MNSSISTTPICGWDVCSTLDVINGNSPLGKDGQVFYYSTLKEVTLSEQCLWLFSGRSFDNQEMFIYSRRFSRVTEAICGVKVSSPGFLLFENDSLVMKQPASVEALQQRVVYEMHEIEEKLITEIIMVTNQITALSPNKLSEYTAIFEYLSEIRQSPLFVSQLALWSFLENRWAEYKDNSSHAKSLDVLLKLVFSEERGKRKAFKNKVDVLGKSLGKDYQENHLRNILAHGKHVTLKENWSNDQWNEFSKLHKELFELVICGLSKEIEKQT